MNCKQKCSWFQTVFLTPGDSLTVRFDRQQFLETIRFTGRGAYANTYLTRAQRQFDYAAPGTYPEEQFKSLPPTEYRQRVDARLQQQLDTLAAYHARQPLPEALLHSRRQVLAVRHATSLLRYVTVQKIKTQREPQLPADYYDFLTQLPLREYYLPNVAMSLYDPLAHFLVGYREARLLPPGGQLATVPGTAERLYAQATADFGDTPARDYVMSMLLSSELSSHATTSLAAVQAILPTFRARTRDSLSVREVQAALRANTPLQPGNLAPEFRLTSAEGKAVALKDLRGKVVYIDFWYSSCKPCLAEAPAAQELKKKFLGQDVVFLYISIDQGPALWHRTIAKYALDSPNSVHLQDPEGWLAARPFHVSGYPSYWIIGRDGRIRQGAAPRPSAGPTTVAALEQALAK
ncbi:TlpA family protein disulfide reductase [Siccationidurans soli]|uniref:TlpA family protein disulfide reductase n=1 Tax=Hymenobacter negativus TaxID=2795026 RepID=A0ABS3QI61_9BACT|nr:TlpA family protein disulfide reductase [Hymenobacter negativus]